MRVRTTLDSHEQQVAKRYGQLRVRARGEQLLGVKRVSLRALEQPRDQVRAWPLPEDALDLLGQLFGGERRKRQPAHAAHARELGDKATHRMLSRKLVETKRGDRQDALAPCRANEEREEVARRAVGPVEVLDDEHDRSLARQRSQQPEQQREHPSLVRRVCLRAGLRFSPQLRPQPRQLLPLTVGEDVGGDLVMEHVAKRAHDGGVRQLAVGELEAFADEHKLAVGDRTALELGDQATLADAGIAGDHDRARVLREGTEFPFATHEPLARNAPTHSAIIHTGLTRLKERGER